MKNHFLKLQIKQFCELKPQLAVYDSNYNH